MRRCAHPPLSDESVPSYRIVHARLESSAGSELEDIGWVGQFVLKRNGRAKLIIPVQPADGESGVAVAEYTIDNGITSSSGWHVFRWGDAWTPGSSKFKFEFPDKDFVAIEAGGQVFVLGTAASIPPELLPGTWILIQRGDETEVVSLDRGLRFKYIKSD